MGPLPCSTPQLERDTIRLQVALEMKRGAFAPLFYDALSLSATSDGRCVDKRPEDRELDDAVLPDRFGRARKERINVS